VNIRSANGWAKVVLFIGYFTPSVKDRAEAVILFCIEKHHKVKSLDVGCLVRAYHLT
jgi:hypothetical protein